MMSLLIIAVLVIISAFLVKVFLHVTYSYWSKKGVPTAPYHYVVGSIGDSLTLKKSLGQIYEDIYNNFDGYNYVGYYRFFQPGIVIRNIEIIKTILSKEFNHFGDNEFVADEKVDVIMGKNPFSLKGDAWKETRAQMTPLFTSAKVKPTTPLVAENAKKLCEYLKNVEDARNGNGLEAKELFSRYTLENVASVAFGLKAGCFEDEKSEFHEMGEKLTKPSFWSALRILAVQVMPTLSKYIKVKFFTDEVTDFLRRVMKETLLYRKNNNIVRNDFLDYLSNFKETINDEKKFNDEDILAHCGGFFGDGYETSSISISYAMYNIAANPDVQKKLQNEIDELVNKNGSLNYDDVMNLNYLDLVWKETLRLHSPVLQLSRVCTKQYTLPPAKTDGTGPSVIIEPGTVTVIPILGLHADKELFPEPEKFKPERFANESEINKFAYLPFGEGPRMCLGMKFGILQSKYALASIVKEFNVTVNKKTIEPLVLSPEFFMRSSVGGVWLDFEKR